MLYIVLSILGLVFGSFGSVLISRLQGEVNAQTWVGILKGRSRCPYCGHTLTTRDLIPLLSFLLSKGKCRYCGKSIGLLYPILELASSIIFVGTGWWVVNYFGFDIGSLIFWILANRFLFLIFISDILSYHLNIWLWILLVFWILLGWFIGALDPFYSIFWGLVFFVLFGALRFGAKFYVQLRYKIKDMEGLGSGDVFVAFSIGLLVGGLFPFKDDLIIFVPLIYLVFAAASSLMYSFVVALGKRFNIGKSIPFLPGMIFAFWILMFGGDKIISWLNF